MPQIYEGLVQRGERLPEMFQAGLERGRGERRRRDLGALMSAGNLDKASAYAFQEGLLDQGLEIQGMAADRAQAEQAAEDERSAMFREMTGMLGAPLGRIAQIEDEQQRGEAIATVAATMQQMYPQLSGEIEEYGAQLFGASQAQLASVANAMGYEPSEYEGERVVAINPGTGQREYAFVTPQGDNRFTGALAPEPDRSLGQGLARLGDALAPPAERESTRDEAASQGLTQSQALAGLFSAARDVSDSPVGAFGPRGQAATRGGALVETLLGQDAGEAVSSALSGGASQSELANLRARTRMIMSQNIPTITAEESGRYTEAERQLAAELTGAQEENTLTSRTQIMSAYASLIPLKIGEINRNALLRTGRMAQPFVSPDGVPDMDAFRALGDEMEAAGFDADQIERTYRDLIAISNRQWEYAQPGGSLAFVEGEQ